MGYTREEALERVSSGYLRHGVSVYAYMTLLLSGNLQASIYRMSPGGGRLVVSQSRDVRHGGSRREVVAL